MVNDNKYPSELQTPLRVMVVGMPQAINAQQTPVNHINYNNNKEYNIGYNSMTQNNNQSIQSKLSNYPPLLNYNNLNNNAPSSSKHFRKKKFGKKIIIK